MSMGWLQTICWIYHESALKVAWTSWSVETDFECLFATEEHWRVSDEGVRTDPYSLAHTGEICPYCLHLWHCVCWNGHGVPLGCMGLPQRTHSLESLSALIFALPERDRKSGRWPSSPSWISGSCRVPLAAFSIASGFESWRLWAGLLPDTLQEMFSDLAVKPE